MLRSCLMMFLVGCGGLAVAAPAQAVAFRIEGAVQGASGTLTDPGLRPDQRLVASFEGNDSLSYDASRSSGFGYFTGSHPNVAAAPKGDTSRYVAIGAGGSMLFDLRQFSGAADTLASVSVYLGSIDVYNFIDVLGLNSAGGIDYDHPLFTVAGADLIGRDGGHPNGRLTFGFGDLDRIGGIVFRSTGVAFEFDSVAVSSMRTSGETLAPGSVPEPATWGMMLGGFGLVGGAMRRRAPKVASGGDCRWLLTQLRIG